MKTSHVLLLNPWIYDFAAHNLWTEPLGLLTIAAVLVECGYGVTLIDCLAPHPAGPPPRPDGSGKFLKTRVDKLEPVAFVPRRFGRYGLPLAPFEAALAAAPPPDLVMVTSAMTYWYLGVQDVIARVRARFGLVPVALGGVYATLCPEHARRYSGADEVIVGPGVVAALNWADALTGRRSEPDRYADPHTWPPPAHDLVARPYAGLITAWGCPYRCTYCASCRLQPTFIRREPEAVVTEIISCVRRGIHNFAFYDDALLLEASRHLVPILEGVLAQNLQRVRFHTPNGLHARQMTADLAALMHRAGFATVRLSLETTDPHRQRASGAKVSTEDVVQAVAYLREAGFGPFQVGVYVLAGLPDQPLSEVEATIRFVHHLGVQAKLALFSPIPGTPDGDRALPEGADPLLHNNTVRPYVRGADYAHEVQRLKHLVQAGNAALGSASGSEPYTLRDPSPAS
jgi:radical SAM superfamily enzyme YgiQ (UPF0313 family)